MKQHDLPSDFNNDINRRQFLSKVGGLALGAAALKLSPLTLSAADLKPLNLNNISESDALKLAQVSRLLFPHDGLKQEVYLRVVADMDKDINNKRPSAQLVQGISELLNKKAGGEWSAAGNEKQVEVLKSMEGEVLFQYLHARSLETIYQDPVVWELLGYQGSSVEHGGYLHRGFNDIDWLE